MPAAEAAPQVAHDEFRLVIDRLQIGFGLERRRRVHAVEDFVERFACVEALQRLVHQRLQVRRSIQQRRLYPRRPGYGQPVARQQQLGVKRRHGAQRRRPFHRVALHFLRIARVGRRPDEQVASAQRLRLGQEHPGVIVGLALGMMQLEARAADRELERVRVGVRRRVEFDRPLRRDPELARVDDRVVARGPHVALHARQHIVVADDARRLPAAPARLGEERRQAVGVVDMAMRVDRGVHALAVPVTHGVEAELVRGGMKRAGIDEHQTFRGLHGGDVDEGLEERHARGELLQQPRAREWMEFRLRRARFPAPQAIGAL